MTTYYLLRRLALSIISFLGVLVITFMLSYVVPGDPAVLAAGRVPDRKVVERIRKEMGLDKPVYVQFIMYLERLFLRQDLGKSVVTKRPVVQDLKIYFPATFELVTLCLILITIFGVWAGVVSAVRRNSALDHTIRAISLSGISMPEFWLAMMLQLIVIQVIRGFPIDGRVSIDVIVHHPLRQITGFYLLDSLVQQNWLFLKSALLHLILPVSTLTFALVAYVVRITRAAMLEILNLDYIQTARATGISSFKVVYKYALRNALIPVLTIIGMVYGFLLRGTVLTELIFSWPGIGRYAVNAIFSLDFPAIMGVAILGASMIILLNLIVDVLCAFVNPTVRYR